MQLFGFYRHFCHNLSVNKKLLPSLIFRTFCHSLFATHSETNLLPGFRLSTALPWSGWGMSHDQYLTRHTERTHSENLPAFDFKPRYILQCRTCHVINNFIIKSITNHLAPQPVGISTLNRNDFFRVQWLITTISWQKIPNYIAPAINATGSVGGA